MPHPIILDLDTEARALLNPASAAVGCAAIWALAFALIAPYAFSLTIGPYYFNVVTRYEVVNGKCKPIIRDSSDGLYSGLFLFNVAAHIPFFFILVSYIFISTVLEVEKRRKQRVLDSQTQVPVRQIQVTLVALSAAILIFFLPLVMAENIGFGIDIDISFDIGNDMGIEDLSKMRTALIAAWAWNYWMYAVNFILYVTTLKDYRMMFKQVFKEFICHLPMAASRIDI